MSSRDTTHRKKLKPDFDVSVSRQSRLSTSLQLRRNKKDERLQKRRGYGHCSSAPTPTTSVHTSTIQTNMAVLKRLTNHEAPPSEQEALKALTDLRKLVTDIEEPPFDELTEAGAIPFFAKFLLVDKPEMNHQAVWALLNIASTSRAVDVAQAGAIPHLVNMLSHYRPELREEAAWCLANIAGNRDANCHRSILQQPALIEGMVSNITHPQTQSLLNTFTWAIRNICKSTPQPSLSATKDFVLPLLNTVDGPIRKKMGCDHILDAVWALANISDGDEERIQVLLDAGALPILMKILKEGLEKEDANDRMSLVPAVRCIAQVTSGDQNQLAAVVRMGFLEPMVKVLDGQSTSMRKDVCRAIANIAESNMTNLHKCFKARVGRRRAVDMLVHIAIAAAYELRVEAVFALSTLLRFGDDLHLQLLVGIDVIRPLCEMLAEKNAGADLLLLTMESLERLLETDVIHNRNYRSLINENGGYACLLHYSLDSVGNEAVGNKAAFLLHCFFRDQYEEDYPPLDDELLEPVCTGTSPKQLFPPESTARDNMDTSDNTKGGTMPGTPIKTTVTTGSTVMVTVSTSPQTPAVAITVTNTQT